jgi:hypothetical protein
MALSLFPFLAKDKSIHGTIQSDTLSSCLPIACSPRKLSAIIEGVPAKRAQIGAAALEPFVEAIVVKEVATGSALLIGKLLLSRHDGVTDRALDMSLESTHDILPESV